MNDHLPIFVYGTLKRGEVREKNWPHRPVKVREATLTAALYDLGPYPAIGKGDDVVAGELWFVREEHMDATLAALDQIECYGQDDVDLYVRKIVECRDAGGDTHRAHTYFYANEAALPASRRVKPDAAGRCRWTGQR